MKTITRADTKALIFDLVTKTDDLLPDDKGFAPIQAYPMDLYRGVKEIQTKVTDVLEVGVVPIEKLKPGVPVKDEDIEWTRFSEYQYDKNKVALKERHTAEPIELSDKAIEALRHYKAKRKLMTVQVSVEALDEVEALCAD